MALLLVDTTAVIVASIGTAGTFMLGALTLLLNKKVKDYHREVNGKMSILLEAKKAEGKLEEKEHQEIKTDILVDKLVEASKQIPTENKT